LAWWGWLGTLKCAPLKVSSLILPAANIGGLVWLKKNISLEVLVRKIEQVILFFL